MTEEKKIIQIIDYETVGGDISSITVNLAPAHLPPKEALARLQVLAELQAPTEEEKAKKQIIDEHGEISSAKNAAPSKTKHVGRKNYKALFNEYQDNSIDLWYKNPHYGRTNAQGEIARILIDQGLSDSGSVGSLYNIQAPRFLHKKLREMKEDYGRRIISKESTFLTKFEYKKGYESENVALDAYISNLYDIFYDEVLEKLKFSPDIKNIDDFYRLLRNFLSQKRLTLTFPGFLESNNYVPYGSGLVYDIHDGDPDSDSEKVDFYNDPNFNVYKYVVKSHGFKIDPNVPWRFIVDLRSNEMEVPFIDYFDSKTFTAGGHGVGAYSTDKKEIFKNIFTPPASYVNFSTRYNGFATTLQRLYRKFINEDGGFPNYSLNKLIATKRGLVDKAGNTGLERITNTKNIPREKIAISLEKNEVAVVENKYFHWYLEIRNAERGIFLSSTQIKVVKQRINQIYNFAKFVKSDFKKFMEFANIALNYIEFTQGTAGAVATSRWNKEKIIVEKNPIVLLDRMLPQPLKIQIAPNLPLANIEKDGKIEYHVTIKQSDNTGNLKPKTDI